MRKQRILRALACSSVLALAVSASGLLLQQSAGELLEKALYVEEAQGDLQKAIGMYEDILKRFPNDREVAAKAQLHIGLCYEKLGLQEAPKAYQKVVDNYPEQTALVEVAKEKLSDLLRARSAAESGGVDLKMRKIGDLDCLGAPSPDGRLISMVDWSSGDLALYEVASGKTRRLTNKGSWAASGGFAEESIFSPDGKFVAYNWFNSDRFNLRIIAVDGTQQRILCDDNDVYFLWPCGWTEDGQSILAILTNDGKDMSSQIAWISAADRAVRTVKKFEKEAPGKLSLSPDGQWIAFTHPYDVPWGEASEKRDVFLVSADGSREIPLVTHPADDRLLGWSPDGRWILFASDRSGRWDTWIQSVEEGATQGDPLLVKRDFGGPETWPMGFTNDGSFYYGIRESLYDVYVVPLDPATGGPSRRAEKAALSFEGSNGYPCWSPDGSDLAYTSFRKQDTLKPSVLCVKSLTSGEVREYFPDIKDFDTVAWLPDGNSILLRGVSGHRLGLFKVNLATEKTDDTFLILEDMGGLHGPILSRDGKTLFYDLDDFENNIFRIIRYDLDTKQKKEIIRGPSQIIDYDLTPDGKWLAFKEGDGGVACLKLIPSEGGDKRLLLKLEKGEGINSVAWTPDGKFIYFSKWEKGSSKSEACSLWRISAEGGKPEKYDLTMDGLSGLDFHPDGRRLVFNSWRMDSEVWVMENFLPKKEEK